MEKKIDWREHAVDEARQIATEIGLHLLQRIHRGRDGRHRPDLLDASGIQFQHLFEDHPAHAGSRRCRRPVFQQAFQKLGQSSGGRAAS